MRILALDPGARVGWASAVVTEVGVEEPADVGGTYGARHALEITGHGIAYMKDAATQVRRAVVDEGRYDVVVYEKWALTAKGARVLIGSEMEWCQFIGIVRQACWDSGTKQVKQLPSVQTPVTGSAVLSLKCGHPSAAAVQRIIDKLPAAHDESHDRSALLHAWHWFFTHYV